MLHKMLGSEHMWMSDTTCLNPDVTTYHACNDKRRKGIVEANIRAFILIRWEKRDRVRDLTFKLRPQEGAWG